MGSFSSNQLFSLLHVDYVKLGIKWNYKTVISPYYRLYFIDEGKGKITSPLGVVDLEAGYLYLIPSFTVCDLSCDEYLSQYFVQFFEESGNGLSLFANQRKVMRVSANEGDIFNFKRLLEINPGRGINRSDNPKVYEKDIYYKEYQDLNHQQSLSCHFETQGILYQLIAKFLNKEPDLERNTSDIPSKIMESISYIQLNMSQKISVNLLASRANMHVDYFSRLFLQATGLRPISYILDKRIERAQYLMITGYLSFDEIASQTGFESVSYFSRVFKSITGMTPGQYKNRRLSV
ncbi:helix-turn-helix domain-containing protein [Flectobacillus rivi]|uniref:AraC family transcriptional regulator n=1 Tax=Flectobacillus rivi TaxID=2984209 RepID=A0ABT6Z1K7_9BACT|nr:AraC family transcriptional regulator [Flectobacillus rivi]MDI9874807.1 AraC family transcriptional regulator [Flectobacillus rivi]